LFQRENSKGKRFTGASESLINQISRRYNPSDSMMSTRKLKEPQDGRYNQKMR
jgi:synaptonemal complex protein 2